MTTNNEFRFKVQSLRKLPDPIDQKKWQRYFAFCNTKDVPPNFPMETNPRKQNLNQKVAKKIKAGFLGEETGQMFHMLNRGILLSAQDVSFNNEKDELTILMTDHTKHGLVDGGHTYKTILEYQKDLPYDQYVTLEIMTGIEDDFEEIAGSRNTSVQVKEKSLAELEGKLDPIKRLVNGSPFENDIAYMEFDEKEIDVQEVVSILTIFNNNIHSQHQPVYTYSSKGLALATYLKNVDAYPQLQEVAADIFWLHDHVKKTMADMYKRSGGHLGKLKEIGYKEGKKKYKLYFSPKSNGDFARIEYDVPAGFVYPILGGMRFLLEYQHSKGLYKWRTDPIDFYDKVIGEKLVKLTVDASIELGRNPMAVGKSSRHWEGLYNYVAATFLQSAP